MMRFSHLTLMVICGLFSLAAVANAQHGLIHVGGPGTSIAYAINDLDEVVGRRTDHNGHTFAFLYTKQRALKNIPSLGGTYSEARAINDVYQITGTSVTSYNEYHAFVYSLKNGFIKDIGTKGINSYAYGINLYGEVVGATDSNDGSTHAFLYSNGKMTDLGTLGGTKSLALGINGKGEVVGYSYLPGDTSYRAFGYASGVMYDLGSLGGNSVANSINDDGEVVGMSYLASGAYHAFVSIEGKMTDLGTLNAGDNSVANCINNQHEIVGASGGQAFRYSHGHMTALPDVTDGVAYGVNNYGQVVGAMQEGDQTLGFLYRP